MLVNCIIKKEHDECSALAWIKIKKTNITDVFSKTNAEIMTNAEKKS